MNTNTEAGATFGPNTDAFPFSEEQLTDLARHLMSGETLANVLGSSVESENAVYFMARALEEQAKYDDAKNLYSQLMLTNQYERRYFIGFGACMQKQGLHEGALKYYAIASMLDLSDPGAPMFSAECHLALGDKKMARQSVEYALKQARFRERDHHFVPRLEAMLSFMDADAAAASTTK